MIRHLTKDDKNEISLYASYFSKCYIVHYYSPVSSNNEARSPCNNVHIYVVFIFLGLPLFFFTGTELSSLPALPVVPPAG